MQYQLKAKSAATDAAGYTHLRLERPGSFDYLPGQYVTLGAETDPKPRFLAIASHRSESHLLFVSGQSVPTAAEFTLSEPQGKGFTCDFTAAAPFLFLTHGTGISAIRSAVIERQVLGHTGDTLLYGIADATATPDIDCLGPAMPLMQLRAYSRASAPQRVQDVLQTLDLGAFAAIIIIGSKEMMQSCREIIAQKDFDPACVYSNY